VVNEVPPAKRGIAMVFQSYALYPHMTVFENMAFGLKSRRNSRRNRSPRCGPRRKDAADRGTARPQAETAFGRAAAARGDRARHRARSRVFLFDEPLSNLDAALRVDTRLEIAALNDRLPDTTMIYVTHDQVEAMTLADRIVVLNAGRIEQVGTPMELYETPASLFVAGFIGSPRMNFLTGPVAEAHGAATYGIRPEHITVSTETGDWRGHVTLVERLGSDSFIHVEVDGVGAVNARVEGRSDIAPRTEVFLTPDAGSLHLFDASGQPLERTVSRHE
jgi:multiple sugar transport system ATP-binding protein